MSVLGFLLLLLVAGICGAIAQAIVGFSRGGCLASVGVGLVGALLGLLIARAAELPELLAVNIDGTRFPIVWTLLGSALFVLVLSLIARAWTPRGPVV